MLGEASDFEREELNRLIEEWPDLAAFKEQIQGVHGLLRDVATGESVAEDDDWKLSAEKRNAVLAVISGETEEQPAEHVVTRALAEERRSVRRSLFWNLTKIAAVSLCRRVVGGHDDSGIVRRCHERHDGLGSDNWALPCKTIIRRIPQKWRGDERPVTGEDFAPRAKIFLSERCGARDH